MILVLILALEMTTSNGSSCWSKGCYQFANGKFEEAAVFFRQCVVCSRSLFNVSMCYLLMGDLEGAVITLRQVCRMDPFLAIAHVHVASALMAMGEEYATEALESYTTAIECMRDSAYIDYEQLGLAQCLFKCDIYINLGLIYRNCHAVSCRGRHLQALVCAMECAVTVHQRQMVQRIFTQTMQYQTWDSDIYLAANRHLSQAQDDGGVDEEEESDAKAIEMLVVLKLKDETRRFRSNLPFDGFYRLVCEKLQTSKVCLRVMDADGDCINLLDQDDWQYFTNQSESSQITVQAAVYD